MKTTHSTKAHSSDVVAGVKFTGATFSPAKIRKGSAFAKVIETKKHLKAYAKGEITLAQLESMGIELG
ncbi:hypothetical protein [Dyadobacter fermentans]|uniref:hypothetical protein n=1 Tax=Dyadobacter fermentans TaxID=94254 RepID=UPI001CBE60FA|nr:hypothetical protein [Dyadobacter fermentans]MBZ1362125.1 hypothetical protein [Dyadobacter fermentans]